MSGTILVVDDHPLYREALVQMLAGHFPGTRLLVAGSAAQGLQQAEAAPDLRLVLLDLALPGLSGIEAVGAFRRCSPDAALVVVTASDERRQVAAAFAAGARAFVSKATPSAALVEVLQGVLRGDMDNAPRWITPAGDSADWRHATPGLTPRQREILLLLCEGHANKEIALRCGLAEITVKIHVSALFKLLGASNRTQAVLAARHAGLYVPEATDTARAPTRS